MSKEPTVGRPTSFSREDAIERAMNVFWHDGYLAVTTRDLANAMNIQRSSFYNTFGSKEVVFTEALQRYTQQAPDAALDDIRAGQTVMPVLVKTLRELCRVRAADNKARGCLVCNSVAELVGVDENLGKVLDSAVNHRIATMEQLFTQAASQDEYVPRAPVPDIARSFVSFLLGLNVASKSIRSERELWSICRTFLIGIGVDERYMAEAA